MYDLPSYVWALVLAGAIGIPAATSAVLYRGAIAASLGRRAATTVVTGPSRRTAPFSIHPWIHLCSTSRGSRTIFWRGFLPTPYS